MNRIPRTLATLATVTLIATGCGTGKNQFADPGTTSPTPSSSRNWPPPEDAAPTADPVVETPTPTPEFLEAKFGESGTFTQGDNSFTVTVATPTKAKCQYSSLGCEKPATGDRVVTAKVTVKNTSPAPIEIGKSQFILEFADGTRMEPGDGNALEYQPDNAMEYSLTMRPGSTYTSTLTFEAPKGAFNIILLDNSYGGDDLFMWQ